MLYLYLHQKISCLIADKEKLKQRLQKDESDLNKRLLELTVLYETSNALGYSLNYFQIVKLVLDSLRKVLPYDVCSCFLLDFSPAPKILLK